MNRRPYAETYTMRSTFYRLMGDAGRLLAEAWTVADRQNRQDIKAMAFEAMCHALVEHHGWTQDEIEAAVDTEHG